MVMARVNHNTKTHFESWMLWTGRYKPEDKMAKEQFHYFIELQSESAAALSRIEENNLRRAKALEAIDRLRDWLHQEGLEDKVSTLSPTMFGQVHITCAADVIKRIRDEESVAIATVRQGNLRSYRA